MSSRVPASELPGIDPQQPAVMVVTRFHAVDPPEYKFTRCGVWLADAEIKDAGYFEAQQQTPCARCFRSARLGGNG